MWNQPLERNQMWWKHNTPNVFPGWILPHLSASLPFLSFPHPQRPDKLWCPAHLHLCRGGQGNATLWLPHRSSGMDGNLSGSYQTRSRSFLNLCSPVWISWTPHPSENHHHRFPTMDTMWPLCRVLSHNPTGATLILPLLQIKSSEKGFEEGKEK